MSALLLPTLVVTFGLQLLRIFFPSLAWYLKDTVGMSSLELAPIALGTFLLIFAAPRSLWFTAGGLALARVAEQLSTIPLVDLILSVIGTVFFLWCLPVLAARRPRNFLLGFLLGIALDSAIKGAAGTLDLSWISGPAPMVVVGLLAFVLLKKSLGGDGSLRRLASDAGAPPAVQTPCVDGFGIRRLHTQLTIRLLRIFSTLCIGPFLFLNMLVLQNQGWIAQTFHLSYWSAFAAVMGVNGVMILCSLPFVRGGLGRGRGALPPLSPPYKGGGFCLGISMLLFIVMVFAYYVSFDIKLPLIQRTLPVAWSRGGVTPPLHPAIIPGHLPLTVMTYNIHSGYTTAGRQDPEAIARVIEESGVDVIALQEVSRGWLIDGSTDLVSWFEKRLKMRCLFAPTADRVWGNAILTRFPIVEHGGMPLPSDLLGRGILWAKIDVGAENPVLVVSTHFHHRHATEEDDALRVHQLEGLLDFLAEEHSPVVLMGDLNTEPGTTVTKRLEEAGWRGVWNKIDYIWHTPDLTSSNAHVVSSLASDHFPVVATLGVAEATTSTQP